MRADSAGFAGNESVRTPALDEFASRSIVYDRAFAQCPLCTPSRASLFTGQYMRTHGAWWNGMPRTGAGALLPEVLKKSGYATHLVGKLHLHPDDASHGFDHKELHEERLSPELNAYTKFLDASGFRDQSPRSYTDWSFRGCGICRMPEQVEETRWTADRTEECLGSLKSRSEPFFLFTSFIRPHTPFNPLERFAAMYDDTEIPAFPFDKSEWEMLPPRIRAHAETGHFSEFNRENWALMRRRYYALCTQIDESVGRVLDSLERNGLAEDTIVVFTSDHGELAGQHGLVGKGHPWDGSLHVPLIIYDPRESRRGVHVPELVELVDVMPTLLDRLGLEIPVTVQGRLLPGIGTTPTDNIEPRSAVFSESVTHTIADDVRPVLSVSPERLLTSVRTDKWRYTHYVGEPGELYDLETDPGEQRNLFSNPATESIRHDLSGLIFDWMTRTQAFQEPRRDNSYFSSYFASLQRNG